MRAFARSAGTKEDHLRNGLLSPCAEDCDIAAIGCGVVAVGRAAHGSDIRLVEKLCRCDVATDGAGVVDKLLGLGGGPKAACIARSGADGKGGH